MTARIDVGIAGATGLVGQHLIARLVNHPWFRVAWVGASDRSAGQRIGDLPWRAAGTCPSEVSGLRLDTVKPGAPPLLVFSALDASAADTLEPALAAAGHTVVSNARSFRMRADVPLVIPEINPGHLDLISTQPWRGAIITNPNCSTTFLALALAPLAPFGITGVTVSTLQALSGAGYPGVASLDALANVIPFIPGEEEKIEAETLKILDAAFPVSAQTTRVPVAHGHTELISVGFEHRPSEAEVRDAWRGFRGSSAVGSLPSAPASALEFVDGDDRPQPARDVDRGGGMTVSLGRLRACPVLAWRFVALGHNLVRGAAGAAVLNAELALASHVLDRAGARLSLTA
ncbi:MAG: aspartate-semialdehyde dehydrogenase [Acidobacteriota bacterium]|nr:aspartate-semialdehyde dehydrogenase [Acidobacteriota bacterium]